MSRCFAQRAIKPNRPAIKVAVHESHVLLATSKESPIKVKIIYKTNPNLLL